MCVARSDSADRLRGPGPQPCSRANAMIQMTTMLGILGGAVLGGFLLDSMGDRLWACGGIFVGLATAGFLVSLFIIQLLLFLLLFLIRQWERAFP